MNPTHLVLGLLAVGGAAWYFLGGGAAVLEGRPGTFTEGGTQYWSKGPGDVQRLTDKLAALGLAPETGKNRVWLVTAGAALNALEHVRAIQLKGGVAATTANLFDDSAQLRRVVEFTPEEFGELETGPGLVVLPVLLTGHDVV